MRFMGGKGRIAKDITQTILHHIGDDHTGVYFEPFIGGGGIASKLGQHFDRVHYSDAHPDLIMMWQALHDGWKPPTEISLERYQELRSEPSSAERGFVGFGGSFGGKWFGGYARGGYGSDGKPRNHQAESARTVLKDIATMSGKVQTTFTCLEYSMINPQAGDVVYCDPPYANTTSYSNATDFDHEVFWDIMALWAERGVHVFVSEYQAPDTWDVIWDRPLRSSVRVGSEERHMAYEHLFVYRPPIKPRRKRLKRTTKS